MTKKYSENQKPLQKMTFQHKKRIGKINQKLKQPIFKAVLRTLLCSTSHPLGF